MDEIKVELRLLTRAVEELRDVEREARLYKAEDVVQREALVIAINRLASAIEKSNDKENGHGRVGS